MPLSTFNLTGSWTINGLPGVGKVEITPFPPAQSGGYLMASTMLTITLTAGALNKTLLYFPGTKIFVSERIANEPLTQYIIQVTGSDLNLQTVPKEPIE